MNGSPLLMNSDRCLKKIEVLYLGVHLNPLNSNFLVFVPFCGVFVRHSSDATHNFRRKMPTDCPKHRFVIGRHHDLIGIRKTFDTGCMLFLALSLLLLHHNLQ